VTWSRSSVAPPPTTSRPLMSRMTMPSRSRSVISRLMSPVSVYLCREPSKRLGRALASWGH